MARIRTIKPEFPQSETIGKLSRDARLLFIELWTLADDDGRSRAASRMLASLLFPYDDDAPMLIDGWLEELEREGCIRRYEVEGTTYLDIPNWSKHQKVDHKSASRLPPFSEEFAKPREPSRSLAPDLGPRTMDLVPRNSDADASDASAFAMPADDGWPKDYRERFWSVYPHRVGKSDALAKLDRIRKSRRVSFDKLMSGLDAYIASKPPDRQWCNPATWLNQGRWDDEPSTPALHRSAGQPAQHDLAAAFDRLADHARRMEDAGGTEGWRPT
ncbi:hypothetical protein V5F49_20420 [Xanthobacter sp. V3C-3]|uniref:hypothetical protein n=1 Tax=Xanthobacter lutulentifluminis TaxID=3119935 RepID=UPI00372BA5CF